MTPPTHYVQYAATYLQYGCRYLIGGVMTPPYNFYRRKEEIPCFIIII